VDLYEARDRPGGRLHTVPSGFEEGAEWIDEDHERMRGLLREFGIAEVPAPAGDYILRFRGAKSLESSPWPAAAADARRFEDGAIGAPEGNTIADLVAATCASDEGKWWVTANIRTDEGDEPDRLGLAQWLEFRKLYAGRSGAEGSAYRIDGGGKTLVDAMLSRVQASPRFGSVLSAVRETSSGVHLSFAGFEETADAVILALPLPCLLDVAVDPPLALASELAKLGFAPAVKARFEFADAFWAHEGWWGYMKSDLLIQQTWPDRNNRNALIAYIVGDAARTLVSTANAETLLAAVWSQWSDQAIVAEAEVKNWTTDPFARGAFSLASPGSNPGALRARDCRRVQIAGEYCAEWMGFMEGAIESGRAAAAAMSS
jgi:monoamine oxidase